jgi:hypothetical protein
MKNKNTSLLASGGFLTFIKKYDIIFIANKKGIDIDVKF